MNRPCANPQCSSQTVFRLCGKCKSTGYCKESCASADVARHARVCGKKIMGHSSDAKESNVNKSAYQYNSCLLYINSDSAVPTRVDVIYQVGDLSGFDVISAIGLSNISPLIEQDAPDILFDDKYANGVSVTVDRSIRGSLGSIVARLRSRSVKIRGRYTNQDGDHISAPTTVDIKGTLVRAHPQGKGCWSLVVDTTEGERIAYMNFRIDTISCSDDTSESVILQPTNNYDLPQTITLRYNSSAFAYRVQYAVLLPNGTKWDRPFTQDTPGSNKLDVAFGACDVSFVQNADLVNRGITDVLNASVFLVQNGRKEQPAVFSKSVNAMITAQKAPHKKRGADTTTTTDEEEEGEESSTAEAAALGQPAMRYDYTPIMAGSGAPRGTYEAGPISSQDSLTYELAGVMTLPGFSETTRYQGKTVSVPARLYTAARTSINNLDTVWAFDREIIHSYTKLDISLDAKKSMGLNGNGQFYWNQTVLLGTKEFGPDIFKDGKRYAQFILDPVDSICMFATFAAQSDTLKMIDPVTKTCTCKVQYVFDHPATIGVCIRLDIAYGFYQVTKGTATLLPPTIGTANAYLTNFKVCDEGEQVDEAVTLFYEYRPPQPKDDMSLLGKTKNIVVVDFVLHNTQ